MEDENLAESSSGYDPLWKKLRSFKILPKVSNFLWRACWDIVPHNINLVRRRVIDDNRCGKCGEPENLLHVLRDCDWVKGIWSGVRKSWCVEEAASFREWLALVCVKQKREELVAIALLVWRIWKARNESLFQDTHIEPPDYCCSNAADLLRESQKECSTQMTNRTYLHKVVASLRGVGEVEF